MQAAMTALSTIAESAWPYAGLSRAAAVSGGPVALVQSIAANAGAAGYAAGYATGILRGAIIGGAAGAVIAFAGTALFCAVRRRGAEKGLPQEARACGLGPCDMRLICDGSQG